MKVGKLSNPHMQVKFLAILYRTFLFPLHLLTPVSPMYPGPPSTKNEGLKPKKRKTCSNFTGPKCHFIVFIVISLSSKFDAQDEEARLEEMKSYSASLRSGHKADDMRNAALCLWTDCHAARPRVLILASGPFPVLSLVLCSILVNKHAHTTPWSRVPLRCSLSM